jgi:hypothetical protein
VQALRNLVVSAAFLTVLCAAALLGQTASVVGRAYTPFVWIERKSVVPDQASLPDSVKVFEGFSSYEDGAPLRAWYVDVDYNDKSLAARSFLSNDPAGKEVASSMARKIGALVAINGGYFDMSSNPARTFSLVMNDGRVLVPNIAQVTRTGRRYSVTRSAFGMRRDRTAHVTWIAHLVDASGNSNVYSYDEPVRHTTTALADAPSISAPRGARVWDAVDAIGGGPMLIKDGQIVDTYENEVFFGAGFPNAMPYPARGHRLHARQSPDPLRNGRQAAVHQHGPDAGAPRRRNEETRLHRSDESGRRRQRNAGAGRPRHQPSLRWRERRSHPSSPLCRSG